MLRVPCVLRGSPSDAQRVVEAARRGALVGLVWALACRTGPSTHPHPRLLPHPPVRPAKQEGLVRALTSLPQDQFELAMGLVMHHHPGLQVCWWLRWSGGGGGAGAAGLAGAAARLLAPGGSG